ncbi:PhzF family phenazine biosynthesis protein [Kumtagia ephedrae]|jgi:trans-2,3-dihydro-3-hydroxyanthranilate isomerase|uniref:Phenazine biosynthesis protein PhzF n=1 Tax=Kumtagia ephedrae TaxID=2116701 RepID=A0A2P7S028_9HYPH|nr:PhzF family phenazine biosynthesis protein [Mesorhizobium ephedrae]PSJ55847.1 phenazine biosynthesis protein PhzF [Mesorhizobium ephedrae]
MQKRRYVVYDVFTGEALTGNPLAVVLDAEGLDLAAMQRIAREFNLSESTFVTAPEDPRHKARVRIFTPDYEMPFAGHPTVGTAIALAELAGSTEPSILVLEENIGPVRCVVGHSDGVAFAEFGLAKLPEALPFTVDADVVGAALGLGPHEIGFENHRVSYWSAGVPYVMVPVSGLKVAAKARLDNEAWMDISPQKSGSAVASAYVYCRETVHHDSAFHARMFVPGNPSYEDPATGSAAAAFAGAVARFDEPMDGSTRLWIEQGMEMGRPSRIRLEIDMEGGRIEAARIGGQAVKVAEGVLLV